ncbi:DUF6049 family protein [Bifidobacterium sp. ESL0790]|uniref:DUF6049 family protein n=1 Tax=Bifidobacterium sp. ESL0790 TaxID=2983233 RepID=UPI0023F7A3B8|nr:DUF6049 family protein [Bifidobacterium sp. ESL0790]WEV72465.1 DUF6049 family protein [Bifidobacterium sp. ESL0790]
MTAKAVGAVTLLCALATLAAPSMASAETIAAPESAPVSQNLQAASTTAKHNESQSAPATISIAEATSVVTASSGYHIKAEVRNTSGKALDAGTLVVATNDFYTFVSRTDIQQWADGDSRITVPNELGRVNVPALANGAATTVSIDVNADDATLKELVSWGPKPVRLTYSASAGDGSDQEQVATHTFFTRSSDGLNTAGTPPMNITITMPLTSDGWRVNDSTLKSLMSTGQLDGDNSSNAGTGNNNGSSNSNATSGGNNSNGSSGNNSAAGVADNQTTINALLKTGDAKSAKSQDSDDKSAKLEHAIDQLVAKHPQLQVVTDPTYAQTLSLPPKSSGIMQPGAFDITSYSAINEGGSYEQAGLSAQSWNEATAVSRFQNALNDKNAKPASYAWQGRGAWTLEAVTNARRQGYGTVIDTSGTTGANEDLDDTLRTDKYVVPTDAGDVTVLSAQSELSRLAQGEATDKSADGEQSTAGRLSRFMAQSAFYQMERPYASRNLLVCLSQDSTDSMDAVGDTDDLMHAVEQAPWLALNDLGALSNSDARLSGANATRALAGSSGIHMQTLAEIRGTLASLTASRTDIARFGSSILTTPVVAGAGDGANSGDDSSSSNSADNSSKSSNSTNNSSNSKSSNDTSDKKSTDTSTGKSTDTGNNKSHSDSGDVQSLARQDANVTAKRSKDGCTWFDAIMDLHDNLALHALSSDTATAKRMNASAQSLATQLLNGVSITPSESITVVSESAQMPVTVSNSHPYPVKVKVSSLTNSMEIATSRFATVEVPARSETQTTFRVRVSTSGSATARLQLLDRNSDAFSTPQSTRITSTLRLSDMSGIIFVAVALLLGVLGLWRQFHRVKDPDE